MSAIAIKKLGTNDLVIRDTQCLIQIRTMSVTALPDGTYAFVSPFQIVNGGG